MDGLAGLIAEQQRATSGAFGQMFGVAGSPFQLTRLQQQRRQMEVQQRSQPVICNEPERKKVECVVIEESPLPDSHHYLYGGGKE